MIINSINHTNRNKIYTKRLSPNIKNTPVFGAKIVKLSNNSIKPADFLPKNILGGFENFAYKLYRKDMMAKLASAEVEKLSQIGIKEEGISRILNQLSGTYHSCDVLKNIILSITRNLPENIDLNTLENFLILRLNNIKNCHWQNKNYDDRFLKLSTKLTNKICPLKTPVEFEFVNFLVSSSRDNQWKFSDEIEKFIDKHYGKLDTSEICQLVQRSIMKNIPMSDISDFFDLDIENPKEVLWEQLKYSTGKYLNVINYLYKRHPNFNINLIRKVIDTARNYYSGFEKNGILNFIDKNLEDPNLLTYLNLARKNNEELDDYKLLLLKKILSAGWDIIKDFEENTIKNSLPNMEILNTTEKQNNYIETVISNSELSKSNKTLFLKGLNELTYYMGEDYEKGISQLLYIENLLFAHTQESFEDIDDYLGTCSMLYTNSVNYLSSFEILGEKIFTHLLKTKDAETYNSFMEAIVGFEREGFLYNKNNEEYKEFLIQTINPYNSKLYKTLTSEIKELKSKFNTSSNKSDLINNINDLIHKKNELIKNSIKDPEEAIQMALVYSKLWDFDFKNNLSKKNKTEDFVEKFKPYMRNLSESEKVERNKFLNKILLEVFDVDVKPSEALLKRIDLSNSKYLLRFFNADEDFVETFDILVRGIAKTLGEFSDKNVKNIRLFNLFKHNYETKALFNKLLLNYDKYTVKSPYTSVRVQTEVNIEKLKANAVRNMEYEFNDPAFKLIPENELKKIQESFKEEGYRFVKINSPVTNRDGILDCSNKIIKLEKNGKPIEFKDLENIINIFSKIFSENEFWANEYDDSALDDAIDSIQEHITQLRKDEINHIKHQPRNCDLDLTIQKVDMNDIPHALTLGDDAGCCTSVRGCNGWSAPMYILNKFISAIEIKDGDEFVGNTMAYFGFVDGKVSYILDNIEMKAKYQYNDDIRDGIIKCAQKICKEVSRLNVPIYAGPNRHKVNLQDFELKKRKMSIIGSTPKDCYIYLDFDSSAHGDISKKKYLVDLYKLA